MKRTLLALLLLTACRGGVSDREPIHLVPDMDYQPKFQALEENDFYRDQMAMRPIPAGTVAQGHLDEDDAFVRGMTPDGMYVGKAPIQVDLKTLQRGEERFNIYCSPCHDKSGHSNGLVIQHGFMPQPVDLHKVLGTLVDGEIFNVITNGFNNMPSYRKQIPVADRWAIVTWLRVLQRSQGTTMEDVPADMKSQIPIPSPQAPPLEPAK